MILHDRSTIGLFYCHMLRSEAARRTYRYAGTLGGRAQENLQEIQSGRTGEPYVTSGSISPKVARVPGKSFDAWLHYGKRETNLHLMHHRDILLFPCELLASMATPTWRLKPVPSILGSDNSLQTGDDAMIGHLCKSEAVPAAVRQALQRPAGRTKAGTFSGSAESRLTMAPFVEITLRLLRRGFGICGPQSDGSTDPLLSASRRSLNS